ncbi:family 20 glycosylhydrolase [Microbulbifer bruguierae]|uniref:beta-N-acetylhexosaminidase n=1 Tax=Microbulbifer bruguierae TaxID=3029061 RepID=A0ABY8NBS6_9GAMM|nr:family 20 glycosylhydrolase [Microbulbifer bruguierae]WGL16150.1 family 20 glycosylhydrolase [Microbulbifer bruguierae]
MAIPKNVLRLGFCALLPLTALAGDATSFSALMPYPQELIRHQATGEFLLSRDSTLCFHQSPGARLQAAENRFRQRTERQTGISLPAAARCHDPEMAKRISVIELALTSDGAPPKTNALSALGHEHEAYQLEINPHKITLSAAYEEGILHGLHSLSQLLGIEKNDDIALQPMTINDQPQFRWRGLMLDSVRHFLPVDTIKRQLDGMAAAKLNVFHWHLTDDQGWRFESRSYPKLHQTAANGNFYSREQIREIVAYAFERGIVVVPEIDMPGHASAIAVAYPRLMSAPGPYSPEDRWGVHKPLLNPANPEVYTFAEKILGEVAELFPFEYVHIGGDEVNSEHWQSNPEIQDFMQARQLTDSHALHNYFNTRLAEILAKLDRKMIGWDETLHPGLVPSAAVQSWRGPDALGEIARAGHFGILSTGFYLDQPQYTSYHYRNRIIPEPLDFPAIETDEQWQRWQFSAPRKRGSPVSGTFMVESTEGHLRGVMSFTGKTPQALHNIERIGPYTVFTLDTWMGPLRARLLLQDKTLGGEFVVGNAPYHPTGERLAGSQKESAVPDFANSQLPLTDTEKSKILGGEAALWAEMVHENNIDLRLWPRTFAVAERLWSGNSLQDEDALYQRMNAIDHWAATAVGLQHHTQQLATLKKLFPENLQSHALALSAVLEPAHYYHRHHEKSANETYSRRDPLNRFVDSLPVESAALQPLRRFAENLPEDPQAVIDLEPMQAGLQHLWRAGVAAETVLQQRDGLPAEVRKLAELTQQQMELGFLITARWQDGVPFSPDEDSSIREQLNAMKGMHGEVVLPAVYVLERFMDRLQYSAPRTDKPGAKNKMENQHG